jgi:hypothetical protein
MTNQITTLSRVFIPTIIGHSGNQEFPARYASGRFITAFTKPAICPYLEPDELVAHSRILLA